ncbi:hypothetical protein SynBIOSU31_03388 [Synechococcus sp. BIOS-U3-1]|nr:hypothetical protein SynBIOSU31_03388 [Synechococcus sp. BIOS-U3-1]
MALVSKTHCSEADQKSCIPAITPEEFINEKNIESEQP